MYLVSYSDAAEETTSQRRVRNDWVGLGRSSGTTRVVTSAPARAGVLPPFDRSGVRTLLLHWFPRSGADLARVGFSVALAREPSLI